MAVGWIPKAFDFSMEQKTRVFGRKMISNLMKNYWNPYTWTWKCRQQQPNVLFLSSSLTWWLVVKRCALEGCNTVMYVSELIWTSSVSMFGDRCEDQWNWWRTTSDRSEFLTSCAKTAVVFFFFLGGETWHEEVRDALTSLNEKLREVRLMIEMEVSRRHVQERFHSIFTADWSSTYCLKMVVSEQSEWIKLHPLFTIMKIWKQSTWYEKICI